MPAARLPQLVLIAGLALTSAAFAGQSALPDLKDTEVTLSWADFKALIERAQPTPTPAPTPPADAFVRRAEYHGRLERGLLTLDARAEVEVLADGWVRLPLWRQGAVVSFAGRGALLHRTGGAVELLARGPARYTVGARLVVAAPAEPGRNRLALQLPDAPVNLLDVAGAGEVAELGVEAGPLYRRQGRRVFASLVNGTATLSYELPLERAAPGEGAEVELEPRVLLTSSLLLNVGEGVIGGLLVADYDVRIARVDRFELEIPPAVEIFDATAPGLESWKIVELDGRRLLRVALASPAEGRVRVTVAFEGGYDPGERLFEAPRFAPRAIERESGFVAVATDGAEVELELEGNLLLADVSEIPADVRTLGGNLVVAAKYSGTPAPARVRVVERRDAAVLTAIVERLNATTLLLADGAEATWVELAVTSNRKQFLRLELPDEKVEIWSLLVDGAPARPKRSNATVLVPLPTTGEETKSAVSAVLLRRGAPVASLGRVEPYLPRPDVPISEAAWTIYLPEGRRYAPRGDGFRIVDESAPLLARRRGGAAISTLAGVGRALAPSVADEVSGYVSKETKAAQTRQQAAIEQQLRSRRRGALPVRIAIPGGVGALPRVSAARLLIVGDEASSLTIRVFPGWLRSALRTAYAALVLAAGLLLGLALAGRLGRRRWAFAGLVSALALLSVGGAGRLGVALLVALIGGVVWLTVALARRRRGP